MEVLQAAASSAVLSSLWSSELGRHGLALRSRRVVNAMIWVLNLQRVKTLVCFHSEAACSEQRVSAVSRQFDLLINVLHDDDVDAVHGHEEQGLPPAQREACLCWSLRERLLQHTEETDISSLETPVIN